jgi:hypothetical protein
MLRYFTIRSVYLRPHRGGNKCEIVQKYGGWTGSNKAKHQIHIKFRAHTRHRYVFTANYLSENVLIRRHHVVTTAPNFGPGHRHQPFPADATPLNRHYWSLIILNHLLHSLDDVFPISIASVSLIEPPQRPPLQYG